MRMFNIAYKSWLLRLLCVIKHYSEHRINAIPSRWLGYVRHFCSFNFFVVHISAKIILMQKLLCVSMILALR